MDSIRNKITREFGTLALPDLETLNWDGAAILPAWAWVTYFVYESQCIVFTETKGDVQRIIHRDIGNFNQGVRDPTFHLTPDNLRVFQMKDLAKVRSAFEGPLSIGIIGVDAQSRQEIIDTFGDEPDRYFYSPMLS